MISTSSIRPNSSKITTTTTFLNSTDISMITRYSHRNSRVYSIFDNLQEGSSSNSQHQSTLPEDMVQFVEFLPTETSSGYVFGADSSVVVEQTGRIPSATAGPYYLTTAAATTSTSSATAESSAHTTQTASTSQQRTTRTSTGKQIDFLVIYKLSNFRPTDNLESALFSLCRILRQFFRWRRRAH